MDGKRLLATLQKQLEAQLEELHDASEHAFTPSDDDPSVCAVCGWMGPNGLKLECGHTAREHALELLEDLKAGKVSLGEPTATVVVSIDLEDFFDAVFN